MANILEHRHTANIAAIIGAAAALFVPIGLYLLDKADKAGVKPEKETHWSGTEIFLMVIIFILVLSLTVIFVNARARRNRVLEREVIGKLSAVQESCILTPHYVTAGKHAKHSKESTLSSGGTAAILTNSLQYDMFYSEDIARNIIRGAKYTYILPNTSFMAAHLQNYIVKISESIQGELQKQQCEDAVGKFDDLRSKNLEFCFFDDENLCLYNFAIFRQVQHGHSQPFVQYWWYINPSSTDTDSPMLSHEIDAHHDKNELDVVFELLKKGATKKNGKEVFDNRTNLGDFIGGQ